MGLAEGVEERPVLVDLRSRVQHRKVGEGCRVDGVDAGRDLAALCREARPGVGVVVVAQDATGDRLALDAVHHESASEAVLGPEQRQHARHRDPCRRGRLEELVLRRPVGIADVLSRVAPQDEPAPPAVRVDQVERPRLSRRAAREPAEVDDGAVSDRRRDRARQRLGIGSSGHPPDASQRPPAVPRRVCRPRCAPPGHCCRASVPPVCRSRFRERSSRPLDLSTSVPRRRGERQAERPLVRVRPGPDPAREVRESTSATTGAEHQPSTGQENAFIEKHGFSSTPTGTSGSIPTAEEDTKARYKFPYGDFEKVHRCGVIAAESRAGQRKYEDIESACALPTDVGSTQVTE